MRPPHIEPIALSQQSTVVAEYQPHKRHDTTYQSEAQLEKKFWASDFSMHLLI